MMMMMGRFLIAAASLTSAVCASFNSNLNYYSPSRRHEGLGIDIAKVAKRTLTKRAAPWNPADLKFTHGVASGDPYPRSVIIWTRVAPFSESDRSNVTVSGYVPYHSHVTEQYIKASPNPICVDYRIGSDNKFSSVVDKGIAYTTSDIDFTVKVSPFLSYAYSRCAKLSRSRRKIWSRSRHTTTNSMYAVRITQARSGERRRALTTPMKLPKSGLPFSHAATIPTATSMPTETRHARIMLTSL